MAVAAILNYNFVMLDHPRSPFVHLKFTLKFRVDRVRTFWDIAIRKFRKFGLKCLFRPQKIMFLGSFDPQTLFFIIETHKRGYLMRKHAFWAINGRDRSSGVTCRREQEYKKRIDRTQKVTENSLPTQTPFPSSHINQILRVGSYPGYLFWFQVSLRSVEKCGSSGGSKFWQSHWLGTSLIQLLVATAQAVICERVNDVKKTFSPKLKTQTKIFSVCAIDWPRPWPSLFLNIKTKTKNLCLETKLEIFQDQFLRTLFVQHRMF